MCWDPCPKDNHQRENYPDGVRHSCQTDIWSLGASIFNLAKTDPPSYKKSNGVWAPYPHASISHLCFDAKPEDVAIIDWIHGRGAHIPNLEIPGEYSDALNNAVARATAWDRPDAIQMVKELTILMHENGISGSGPRRESERLPEWCVNIPDFYATMNF